MPHRIAAVYEQGMLRLLMLLDLREHQQVQMLAEEAYKKGKHCGRWFKSLLTLTRQSQGMVSMLGGFTE